MRGLGIVVLSCLLTGSAACQSQEISNVELMRAVQELRAEVARLGAKVSRLETALEAERAAPAPERTSAQEAGPTPSALRPSSAAKPVTKSDRCAASTQKGARCSRKAQAGGPYCWQHARMNEK